MTDGAAADGGVNADTPASYSCRKKRNDNNAATVAIWVEPGNIIMAATVGGLPAACSLLQAILVTCGGIDEKAESRRDPEMLGVLIT